MHRTLLAFLLLASSNAHAITAGQTDDFQNGTTGGWTEGGPSPNQPMVIAGGGPDGVGDAWLQNLSTGGFGPGGAQVMFNFAQWTGDYLAAGVAGIRLDMANFGPDALSMRIAMDGASGTRISSASAALLPADGEWYSVTFALNTTDLAIVSGSDSVTDVLATVSTLRILAAADGPAWQGDFVVSNLGVDNIQAVAAVPLPAALWLMLGGLGILIRWR